MIIIVQHIQIIIIEIIQNLNNNNINKNHGQYELFMAGEFTHLFPMWQKVFLGFWLQVFIWTAWNNLLIWKRQHGGGWVNKNDACTHRKERRDMWHLTVDRYLLSWARSQGFPHFRGNIHDSIRKMKKKKKKQTEKEERGMKKKKKNPAVNHPQYPDTFAPLISSPCHYHLLWIISPVANLNLLITAGSFLWYKYIISLVRDIKRNCQIFTRTPIPQGQLSVLSMQSQSCL